VFAYVGLTQNLKDLEALSSPAGPAFSVLLIVGRATMVAQPKGLKIWVISWVGGS